jgi:hypothetical protein
MDPGSGAGMTNKLEVFSRVKIDDNHPMYITG